MALGASVWANALAVVYCVGKFGGMFKQRNELVDKHHYGYLASTLVATTRICLPTSCTGPHKHFDSIRPAQPSPATGTSFH